MSVHTNTMRITRLKNHISVNNRVLYQLLLMRCNAKVGSLSPSWISDQCDNKTIHWNEKEQPATQTDKGSTYCTHTARTTCSALTSGHETFDNKTRKSL